MSNYRRLISYIYAYEGGVKGKNIGYAKVEVRGDQCRIHVNVKKVYVGSNDIGVYLLSPGAEIMLGKIFIRGGAGEFRVTVQSGNVEGSGYSMDQCYGLTVHDVESTWQCYTTIWEDAVAQAAELESGDVTERAAELELADVTAENIRAREAGSTIQEQPSEETLQESRFPVSEQIEKELSAEEQQQPIVNEAEESSKEWLSELADSVVEDSLEELQEPLSWDSVIGRGVPEAVQQVIQALVGGIMTGPEKAADSGKAVDLEKAADSEKEVDSGDAVDPDQAVILEEPAVLNQAEVAAEQEPLPEPGDPAQLEALDRMEKEEASRNYLWDQLMRRYPRVLAFDYDNGCEILSIKPQDIGLLPREVWVHGNNSFLLHGYYNYRHLILAKLNNPKGRPRYLLGVPGHYFSNEKYMASMFGFPHFVLAKRQPEADGRFGYWYTDIRL